MKLLLLLLFILPLQVSGPADTNETIIFRRMESVFLIRQEVMNKAWPGAGESAYDIPFIYYTDSASYVANPTERFFKYFKGELKHKTNKVAIYKLSQRFDNFPFHMEVHISDNEADFNYLSPYGKVSGLEEVRKYAPNLPASAWTGMILHEFFHGFQFHHPQYWQYAHDKKLIYRAVNDSLQSYYSNYDWYKNSVDEENELILQAIQENDNNERKKLVVKMFSLRDERRKLSEEKINRPVAFYEAGFETMEGTARYIENFAADNFQSIKFPESLLKIDTAFSNGVLKNEKLNSEAGYKTAASQMYTYAIGYNMARLLDKFRNPYKSKLFIQPELTLEKFLRDEVAGK